MTETIGKQQAATKKLERIEQDVKKAPVTVLERSGAGKEASGYSEAAGSHRLSNDEDGATGSNGVKHSVQMRGVHLEHRLGKQDAPVAQQA